MAANWQGRKYHMKRKTVGDKVYLVAVGVSFGYGETLPRIILENKYLVLARMPGATDWSGIGDTKYYHPYYWILEKQGTDGETEVMQTLVDNMEYDRSTMAAAKKLALEKFDILTKEYLRKARK